MHSIILLTDFNGNIRDHRLTQPLWDIGLEEVLMSLHGAGAPPTNQ